MSSVLSNVLTSCQKKTSDIVLSISRATSQASTKAAGIATHRLPADAPLQVSCKGDYGARKGVSKHAFRNLNPY